MVEMDEEDSDLNIDEDGRPMHTTGHTVKSGRIKKDKGTPYRSHLVKL